MRVFRNIVRRRSRSLLTTFGVAVGVFAVVVLGALAERNNVMISAGLRYKEHRVTVVEEKNVNAYGMVSPNRLLSIEVADEIILDMGSGAGFDCFLASTRVGQKGKVIGVDMTSEMVEKARANARTGGYTNIDFRQGDLENMPVADNYVDVVISNCVINLVPNKNRVFKEAFRVLKPGGRLAVSDVVLLKDLPEFVKMSTEAYIGCLAGAIMKDDYLDIIRSIGFTDVKVVEETLFPIESLVCESAGPAIIDMPRLSKDQLKEVAESVSSIKVGAIKPS